MVHINPAETTDKNILTLLQLVPLFHESVFESIRYFSPAIIRECYPIITLLAMCHTHTIINPVESG